MQYIFTFSYFNALQSVRPDGKKQGIKTATYQDRMEAIWNLLLMPDNAKVDMAIKYSSDEYVDRLEEVISAWEAAASLISQREQLMNELETFERVASDPNRFFELGYQGSAVARTKESTLRGQFHQVHFFACFFAREEFRI